MKYKLIFLPLQDYADITHSAIRISQACTVAVYLTPELLSLRRHFVSHGMIK
jgi:hypothetical protein